MIEKILLHETRQVNKPYFSSNKPKQHSATCSGDTVPGVLQTSKKKNGKKEYLVAAL